jgi:enediyne biosynthesis protein E4
MGRANGINDYGVGRGSVVFDMDNDGDLDILIVNQKPIYPNYPVSSVSKIFRNDSTKGNWLKVKLVGKQADSDGIGARVEIQIGKIKIIREIDGGASSHLSQNSTIAHFGLGNSKLIDKLKITWLGGKEQILMNVPVNQLVKILEAPDSQSNRNSIWLYVLVFLLIVSILIFLLKSKLYAKR